MDTLSFGNPDTTWSKYGLAEYPINFNGAKTSNKAITQNGNLITIVSDKYVLLPNEEAQAQADAIAKAAGLVPFDKFNGKNLKLTIRGNDGNAVFFGPNNARMHVMYAIEKEFTVNGEQMWMGVGIKNSIDGSKAFGADIFSFRSACSNMVMIASAGARGWSFGITRQKMLEQVYKRHTKCLDPQTFKLKLVLAQVMDRANGIIAAYEEMAAQKVEEDLIKKIQKVNLPKKFLPDYIQQEESKDLIVPSASVTEWEFYNDITEAIWHNEASTMDSKIGQYNELHKAMPLLVVR